MIQALKRKFVLVTMSIVTVCLLMLFTLTTQFMARGLRADSEQFLKTVASQGHIATRPGENSTPCFIVRVSPWGQSVEYTGGFDLSDGEMLNDIISAATEGQPLGEIPGYSLRYYRQAGPAELTIVFADISAERAAIRNLGMAFAGMGLVSLVAFWGLSVLLARWMVKPVEQAWDQQRQFVADASHELKTPLTVIMTSAELLDSPEGERIRTMSGRMRALVEGLLELARVDNGTVKAVFSDVDLRNLVEEELLPFEPLYFEQGLMLQSDLQEPLTVSGSEGHLRQLLGILLDNAMKYTPPGSTVWVRLTKEGGNALLTVSNPGDPLSKEDCQNIFRRFYRLDQSRSTGGYGLGLPIARGIAELHRGKIQAQSYDGWNMFRVCLPLKK